MEATAAAMESAPAVEPPATTALEAASVTALEAGSVAAAETRIATLRREPGITAGTVIAERAGLRAIVDAACRLLHVLAALTAVLSEVSALILQFAGKIAVAALPLKIAVAELALKLAASALELPGKVAV